MAEGSSSKSSRRKADTTEATQSDRKRLFRSRRDRILGGVCGGLAAYLDVDPTIVRIVWLLFSIPGFFGVIVYAFAWLLIPENPEEADVEVRRSSTNSAVLWGSVLIIIGLFILANNLGFDWDFWPLWNWRWRFWPYDLHWEVLLAIALLLLGAYFVYRSVRPEASTESTKTTGGISGMAHKKLTRSTTDKMIGGVCGGLAEYLNVDTSIVRLAWVFLTLVTGIIWGVVLYFAWMIVVPESTQVEATQPPSSGAGKKPARRRKASEE